jgi:hypothetical protein
MHVRIKHNNIFAGLQVGASALLAALPQMYTDQAGIGKFPGLKSLESFAGVCRWRGGRYAGAWIGNRANQTVNRTDRPISYTT